MMVLTAYLNGWRLSLRMPGVVALKWLVNLCFAVLIVAPLWVLLAQDLDHSLLADQLLAAPDWTFFHSFQDRYAATLALLRRGVWLPLLAVFVLINLWLSAGVADGLRREVKPTWADFFQAAKHHFTACLGVAFLTALLAGGAFVLPLVLWNQLMSRLAATLDGSLLFNFVALPLMGLLVVFGLLMLVRKPKNGGSKLYFIVNFALTGVGVIGLVALLVWREAMMATLARNLAGSGLLIPLYWLGMLFIFAALGSWVMRVHNLARLLVCRPADHDAVKAHTSFTAFMAAVGFVSRRHVATFVLWLAVLLTGLLIFPLMGWVADMLPLDGAYGVWLAALLTQVAIAYRIATAIAGMGGLWVLWQLDRDGVAALASGPRGLFKTNKMPTEKQQPDTQTDDGKPASVFPSDDAAPPADEDDEERPDRTLLLGRPLDDTDDGAADDADDADDAEDGKASFWDVDQTTQRKDAAKDSLVEPTLVGPLPEEDVPDVDTPRVDTPRVGTSGVDTPRVDTSDSEDDDVNKHTSPDSDDKDAKKRKSPDSDAEDKSSSSPSS